MADLLGHFYLEEKKLQLALEQLEIVEAQSRKPLGVKVKISLLLIELKHYSSTFLSGHLFLYN